ncbi:VOC family protein [Virgisporangium ochraceum]|uniref:Glyoxalase n=1 Tax=Virgisporangium ochraceum TaxID=65505 RepID=A0A8J3ZP52_9ACTN|nr:VOC family protein [Virgisporangium ochraceum]GIJ67261.1 glyoxalase [Virgisporangium ochraceum]
MNWTLEVVHVPVSDVDRAIEFYVGKLGFAVDHDTRAGSVRFAQLTPPGSGCSIVVGMSEMKPGSLQGTQLVVNDVRKAHSLLVERGVECGEVMYASRDGGFRPAEDGDDLNNSGFLFLTDPDGNSWAVQQITARP